MTITREQVADLQPGDVVEYRRDEWPEGAVVRSPLTRSPYNGALFILNGQFGVVDANGKPDEVDGEGTPYKGGSSLTVVSRAPRPAPPLYVNHPRTEPAMGDVVADSDNGGADWTWHRVGSDWLRADGADFDMAEMPKRLRLLVDGETGQVVP